MYKQRWCSSLIAQQLLMITWSKQENARKMGQMSVYDRQTQSTNSFNSVGGQTLINNKAIPKKSLAYVHPTLYEVVVLQSLIFFLEHAFRPCSGVQMAGHCVDFDPECVYLQAQECIWQHFLSRVGVTASTFSHCSMFLKSQVNPRLSLQTRLDGGSERVIAADSPSGKPGTSQLDKLFEAKNFLVTALRLIPTFHYLIWLELVCPVLIMDMVSDRAKCSWPELNCDARTRLNLTRANYLLGNIRSVLAPANSPLFMPRTSSSFWQEMTQRARRRSLGENWSWGQIRTSHKCAKLARAKFIVESL